MGCNVTARGRAHLFVNPFSVLVYFYNCRRTSHSLSVINPSCFSPLLVLLLRLIYYDSLTNGFWHSFAATSRHCSRPFSRCQTEPARLPKYKDAYFHVNSHCFDVSEPSCACGSPSTCNPTLRLLFYHKLNTPYPIKLARSRRVINSNIRKPTGMPKLKVTVDFPFSNG